MEDINMFQFYKNVYGGKCIKDEQSFYSVHLEAVQYVRKYTYYNLDLNDNIPNLKECICAICDVLFLKKDIEALESEEFDTFKRKYKFVDWELEIKKKLFLYLPENMLYRGFFDA